MDNKYVSGTILNEQHTLNIDNLVCLVSDLKWNYYEKYHREPKYIKMPLWVYVLLQHHAHQLIGFSDDKISMYMGLRVCETETISELSQIELF